MIEESNDMKGKAVKQFSADLGCKDYIEENYFDVTCTPSWNQLPIKLSPKANGLTKDIALYWKKMLDERMASLNIPLDYSKIKIGYSPKTNYVFFIV